MKTMVAALACSLAAAPVFAQPLRDDAGERARATEAWRGPSRAEDRLQVLREAARERDRWGGTTAARVGPSAARALSAAPAAPLPSTSTFVSIGPTHANASYNPAIGYANTPAMAETDSGRIRQIVPHPTDPATLYVATAGGGVWKTVDGTASWEPLTDGLGTLSVGALAMDPVDPDILWLGFGDPFDVAQPGVVRTTDAGATWCGDPSASCAPLVLRTPQGTTAMRVRDLAVSPENSTALVATDVGLFRIEATLSPTFLALSNPAGVQAASAWSLARSGPGTWLVSGVFPDGTLGLWRLQGTQAAVWLGNGLPGPLSSMGRATLAVAANTAFDATQSRVYLLAGAADGKSTFDAFRSEDGGATWASLGLNARHQPQNPNSDVSTLDILGGQAGYNQALLVDPAEPETVFAGGNLSLVRSADGGMTWSVLSDWLPLVQGIAEPYVHADLHAFALGPDGTFWAGSDGGLFRSPATPAPGALDHSARTGSAADVTFSSASNDGLITHLFYSVACAPASFPTASQPFLVGGLQDNGTRMRAAGSTTFDQVTGGDGVGVAVSGAAAKGYPDAILTSAASPATIYRSSDGGASFAPFMNGLDKPLPFFVRLARDPADADPSTFLTFTSPAAVFVSRGGGNWSNQSGQLRWGTQLVTGFNTPSGLAIGLRALAAHPTPTTPNTWGAVSNKFSYVRVGGESGSAGPIWTASAPITPPSASGGEPRLWLFTSLAFDPADPSGRSFWLTSGASSLVDDTDPKNPIESPLPRTMGHLFFTADAGQTWTSKDPGGTGLPFVPFQVVAVDPGDPTGNTVYVGTALGLYRSGDRGGSWTRAGAGGGAGLGLPLVEVSALCFAQGSSGQRLTAATFGRGLWQLDTAALAGSAAPGNGDLDFDGVLDGLDLLALADAVGSQASAPAYRQQADLVDPVKLIDANDLSAFVARMGGAP